MDLPWLAVPTRQLAFAQITSPQPGIAAVSDVTGLSITFVAGARPVWVEARLGVKVNTAAGLVLCFISDAANAQVAEWYGNVNAGAFEVAEPRRRLVTLTPGNSYSFKVRAQPPGGATLDVQGSVDGIPTTLGGPAYLRAYEEL